MTQCGLIYPTWVQIGWVQWVGAPKREKLYYIERVRCTNLSEVPVEKDGFTFRWCTEHAMAGAAKVNPYDSKLQALIESVEKQKDEIERIQKELEYVRSTMVAQRK